ncbi:MAG: hypothetical protein K2O07_02285, partial [Alistipes sp.]|nr:hypothetical protein [Alistipes sp.]
DYIVAGENMGPAKLQKAKKLGIEIISEQELMQMIGNQEQTVMPHAGTTPAAEKEEKSDRPIQGSLF